MIKQMERQFMLVAVLAISLVMLIILITVNVISRQRSLDTADEILNQMITTQKDRGEDEFDGRLPDGREKPPKEGDVFLDRDARRSFLVVVDDAGELIWTDAADKNIFSEIDAFALVSEAETEGGLYGFAGDYRFAVNEVEGEIHYHFLDYTLEINNTRNLLLTSIGVFFASVLLVAILVYLLLKPFMKPIRNAYSRQKRFITDASHELKTPLTVIATNMQLIEMENGPSEWTESVSRQTDRLKSLTNELVSLARMDEEGTTLVKEEINLSEMVQDAVMGFEPAFIAEGKALETSIEEAVWYDGNYDALERVISVILSNALKYSNDQGRVSVKLKRSGKKIKLKVTNTADGISQGLHNEFFERFYRSDESRNSETGGFGIGLAIAKATIEEHKGKIEAVSKDGKSLTLQIVL